MLLAGVLSSCQEDILSELPIENAEDQSLEVYSLYGTMCQWVNRQNNGEVIIVNSEEDFKKFISCIDDQSPHSFDFEKQTLLLIGSVASSGIYSIYKTEFQQVSQKDFQLNITIRLNKLVDPTPWEIAVRVDKLTEDAIVNLEIEELPAELSSILGRWKLKRKLTSGFASPVEETDFSNQEVIYEFDSNEVLTVTGKGNTGWIGQGNHPYSIGNFGIIKVGLRSSWYKISTNELVIDSRPLDGSAYFFEISKD